VGTHIKVRTDELSVLDRVEEERGLSNEEMERKRVITRELETSRIHWLKEDNKCTKFFHRIANAHKRHNSTESLTINGSTTSDQEVISNICFYEYLFTESLNWRPNLDDLEFDMMDVGEASSLESMFEEREVWEVVKEMDKDKAPGPNGFSMAFF
jgi:hypothetical protein